MDLKQLKKKIALAIKKASEAQKKALETYYIIGYEVGGEWKSRAISSLIFEKDGYGTTLADVTKLAIVPRASLETLIAAIKASNAVEVLHNPNPPKPTEKTE